MAEHEIPCADYKVLKNDFDHLETHVKSDLGDLRQYVAIIRDEKIPYLLRACDELKQKQQLEVNDLKGSIDTLRGLVNNISQYINDAKKMFNRGVIVLVSLLLLGSYPMLAKHIKLLLELLK